ncbi:TetR family transcriptional regulator [Pseudonocardia sp. KRD291]|uniref:TetR/AcrR family transcriptional regulator n=1 Tax=Pseudonocardia sp. KRD291 TaxID=2792007 RepID=UPI001C49E788|nr:TetR family transcriptional regulator [Pseudonocardia sp. KRD291]MBW0102992.1 TetR family transcriptional regulator [Pseudonocardia sp. KRD291]
MSERADPTPRRRGRRAGGQDTRAVLLDAARAEFAERGFDGATVRRIAERAGVDAAMVNHWFGGKESLFTASLDIPLDPAVIRDEVLPGDPEQLGHRIVHRFLTIWDGRHGSGTGPMLTLLRSVTAHPAAARMLREFVTRAIIGPVVSRAAPDRHAERGSLVASQLIGLAMIRYVVRLEPLASAGHDDVAAALAPTLQRYLTGDIGPPSAGDTAPAGDPATLSPPAGGADL